MSILKRYYLQNRTFLFLFSVSVDASVIIIVSQYQEKKVTAVDFIAVFVSKYTPICAYCRLYSNIIAYIFNFAKFILSSIQMRYLCYHHNYDVIVQE